MSIFAGGQVVENGLRLLGGAGARQVVDPHREVGQALAECLEVLIGEHRGGHQHGRLLAVDGGLESRAHGYLGLSEAHIAAYEAVHRPLAFHIGLNGLGGRELVRRIFINEAGLELMLEVAVRRKGMAALLLALGI